MLCPKSIKAWRSKICYIYGMKATLYTCDSIVLCLSLPWLVMLSWFFLLRDWHKGICLLSVSNKKHVHKSVNFFKYVHSHQALKSLMSVHMYRCYASQLPFWGIPTVTRCLLARDTKIFPTEKLWLPIEARPDLAQSCIHAWCDTTNHTVWPAVFQLIEFLEH